MMVYQCINWLQKLYRPSAFAKQELEHGGGYKCIKEEELRRKIKNENFETSRDVAERIAYEFDFSDKDVERAIEGFLKQMNEGLREHGCMIEQLPSFIKELPNGREMGTYLTVDLGGTNLRVCSIMLNGDGTHNMVQDRRAIPTALMRAASSKELFRWVAKIVREFIQESHPDYSQDQTVDCPVFDLGFTFSHAIHQRNINSGTLIRWSKGFDIHDAVGQDICALLQSAFTELEVPVRVKVLLNDTVGTLLARAYSSPECSTTVLGAVFGTGTNGAYVERVSNIKKMNDQSSKDDGIMIINSEWGNFDQKLEYLPTTVYDEAIDSKSVNPGVEMFEKRISGMYLGEILRLVLLSLHESQGSSVFARSIIPATSRLYLQWGIETSFMSGLESDNTKDLSFSRAQIEEWTGIEAPSRELAESVRTISKAIARRSARLSAVALGAVILHTKCLIDDAGSGKRIEIGVDGSLVELYPSFITEIRRTLKAIGRIGIEGEGRIDIKIAKDGSGIGAALAAHVTGHPLNLRT